MAPAPLLQQAAVQLGKGCLEGFEWTRGGEVLEARCGEHVVTFVMQDERLQPRCRCGGHGGHPCLHLVVALMALVRIQHGTKFHVKDLSPREIERFRRQLKPPARMPEASCVRFIRETPGAVCRIDFDSGIAGLSWLGTGAPPGMEWLEWQSNAPGDVADAFLAWVEEGQRGVEFEYHDATTGERARLDLGEVKVVNGRLLELLEQEPGGIRIRQEFRGTGGEQAGRVIALGYGLGFVPETQWLLWMSAQLQPHHREGWQSLDDFHRARLPESEQRRTFDRSGQTVTPVRMEITPALLAESREGRVVLRLRALVEEGELPVHEEWGEGIRALFVDPPVARLLEVPGKRRRLLEAFSQMLQAPERAYEWKCDLAEDPVWEPGEGEEARGLIGRWWEVVHDFDTPFLVAVPQDTLPWRSCERTGYHLARLMVLAHRFFPQTFSGARMEFVLDAEWFARKVSLLSAACETAGIHFRLNEAPVRREQLSLSLEFVETGEVDWFELHPQVQVGAFRLPRESWERILQLGFWEDENGEMVAVEEESLEKLEDFTVRMVQGSRVHRFQLLDFARYDSDTEVTCELPREERALYHALTTMEGLPPRQVPAGLQAELRSYQQQGYEWLAFLYEQRLGAVLADDMGLGKTLQTITFLLAVHEGLLPKPLLSGPALIVLPPTLVFNWHQEIERFAPGLRVLEYVGAHRYLDLARHDVVLTTYDLVRRDQELLEDHGFGIAIFDEAQAIKNPASRRTKAVNRLRAGFRLCLTGTPLENHFREFHQIMETAVPGLLGEANREWEEVPPPHLLARARPFLLRRTKEKILKELPPKVESELWLDLAETQKECYTRAVAEIRREVMEAYREKPAQQAGIAALAALMRLRQICVSPAMLTRELPDDSPKLDLLAEQLAEVVEEGHAALVFSHFVKAFDLLGERLTRGGVSFVRLDGSVPTVRRRTMVKDFQQGGSAPIFMISTKIGGAGLNLTRASYVYHLDPWWNPAVENQASDRAHRLGQRQSVFIQRLLMRHSVEEKISMLKARKRKLFDAVVDPDESDLLRPMGGLSAEDFEFLVE